MSIVISMYNINEVVFTFIEERSQNLNEHQLPLRFHLKLGLQFTITFLNSGGQIIILKQKYTYLQEFIYILISILINEYSQVSLSDSLISFSLAIIILLHFYQNLLSFSREKYTKVLLLHINYIAIRLFLQISGIDTYQSIKIVSFASLLVIKMILLNQKQETDNPSSKNNSNMVYKLMKTNNTNLNQIGEQQINRLQTQQLLVKQIDQDQNQSILHGDSVIEDWSSFVKGPQGQNQGQEHDQSNVEFQSSLFFDYTKIQSSGVLVITDKQEVIKYNKKFLQFLDIVDSTNEQTGSIIQENEYLINQLVDKALNINLKFYQFPKSSKSNIFQEQTNRKINFTKANQELLTKLKERKSSLQNKSGIQNSFLSQCKLRNEKNESQSKIMQTSAYYHTSLEEQILKDHIKQPQISQMQQKSHYDTLNNQSFQNYSKNEELAQMQFEEAKLQNLEIQLQQEEVDGGKQFQKNFHSQIKLKNKNLLKNLQQCEIPFSIHQFFQQQQIQINIQDLIDFLISSKPQKHSANNDQKKKKLKCQNCQQHITFYNVNKFYNKQLNENTKINQSNNIYKYSIKDNFLIITLEIRNRSNKKQLYDFKIGCFTAQQQENNSKRELNLCNKCQQSSEQSLIQENIFNKQQSIVNNQNYNILQNQNFTNSNQEIPYLKKKLTSPDSTQQIHQILNRNLSEQKIKKSQTYESKQKFSKNKTYKVEENLEEAQYIFSIEIIETNYEVVSKNIKSRMDIFRQKMLCSISHELRTPLNCIISMLDILNIKNDISDIIKSLYVNPALFSSYILLNIINDILDMAEVNRSGQIRMLFQEFSLINLCLECLNFIKLQAQQKNLQLEFTYEDNIPQLIYTDINKTRQVLLNLLSNALKFTQNGSVSVKLSCVQEEVIQIDVKDTGCGIPPQKIRQIFLNFNQPDLESINSFSNISSKKKNLAKKNIQNNAGLGLNISFLLASCLGDNRQLAVKSEVGKGSIFTFFIVNRSNQKKELVLQPKYRWKSNNSLKSKLWEEYEDSQISNFSPIPQRSTNEKKIEGRQNSFQEGQNSQNNQILKDQQSSDSVQRKGSLDKIISLTISQSNGNQNNQLSGQLRNIKTQSSGAEDSLQEERFFEELFPENDIQFTGSLRKRRQTSILQSNLSKTTQQLIKQGSSMYNYIYSQKDFGDDNLTHLNLQKGLSSNFNQTQYNQNEQMQISKQPILNRTLSSEVVQSSFNQIPSQLTSQLKQPKIFSKEIESLSKINQQVHFNYSHSPLLKVKQPKKLSMNSNLYNFDQIEESPQPSINAAHRINLEECFKTVIRNNQIKYFNQQLESCEVLNESFDKMTPNQAVYDGEEIKPLTLNQKILCKNAQNFIIQTPNYKFHENQFHSNQIINQEINLTLGSQIQVEVSKNLNDTITNRTKQSTIQIELLEDNLQSIIQYNKQRKCSCPQILIVDDNEFNLYAIEARLEIYHFLTDKATSGFQALDYIKKKKEHYCCQKYKLVFMDIDMPEMNGYQATQEILKLCLKLKICPPVISACSAYIQEYDKQKAFQSGMKFYITKPINASALENIINSVFLNAK